MGRVVEARRVRGRAIGLRHAVGLFPGRARRRRTIGLGCVDMLAGRVLVRMVLLRPGREKGRNQSRSWRGRMSRRGSFWRMLLRAFGSGQRAERRARCAGRAGGW